MKRVIPFIVFAILLASCGAAAPAADSTDLENQLEEAQAALDAAGEGMSQEEIDALQSELQSAQAALSSGEEEAPSVEEPSEAEAEAERTSNGEQNSVVPASQRLIIKDANMTLTVEDVMQSVDEVTRISSRYNGYVLDSDIATTNDGGRRATIQIAVESRSFEQALIDLRAIAVLVKTESSSGEDVTSEYVDLQSRLGNLEATRDRVQQFLEEANTVDEALEVNAELTALDEEIEVIKGRMEYLSGRAAYSTVTVHLLPQLPTPTPTPEPTPTSTPEPTATPQPVFERTVNEAVSTQKSIFTGLVSAFLWLAIVLGPYVLVFAGIVVAAYQVNKVIRK